MSTANHIRSHVAATYVAPARRRGDEVVTVVVGAVLRDLSLRADRAPAVCSALRTAKFRKEHDLELLQVEGPPSKQSTTTAFTFRIPPPGAPSRSAVWTLLGAGRATFAALGGGERWLLRQREAFNDSRPAAAPAEPQRNAD